MNAKKYIYLSALVLLAGLAGVARANDPDIVVTPSSLTFLPGDTITYAVTMINEEEVDLTNVSYAFTLDSADAAITNSTMPTGPQTFLAGQTVSYEVTVAIPADFPEPTLDAVAQLLDSQGEEIQRKRAQINLAVPKLAVTKIASAATVSRSAPFSYTITVQNSGFGAATNVTVVDSLPIQIFNIAVPPASGCTFNAGPRTITCTPFELAAGASKVITFTANMSAAAPCNGTVTNSVAVTADGIAELVATGPTKAICPTPTPTPTPAPAQSSGGSSSGGGGGGGGGGGSEEAPLVKVGKVLAATSARCSARTKDAKAKDFIPNKNVPSIVGSLFQQVFGRPITPAESKQWKERARCDKPTKGKIIGAMEFKFLKAKGNVQGAKTTAKPTTKKVTIASVFESVYGRKPTVSELAYWRKAAVKKNTVSKLTAALQQDKAKNIKH